ncbi:MAG: hypothetical protein ACJAV1_001949 [Paraglaciecola sp.]|jgi:hypothetical protein
MVSQTNEKALEAAIEKHLTGTCLEELKLGVQEAAPDFTNKLYKLGQPSDFDMHYALDTKYFWQFLQNTQEEVLEKLKRNSPNDWERKVLERFDRLIKKHGILHILKKGLSVDDAHLNLMYPAPLVSSSDKVRQNFEANIFSSTRQVRYSQTNPLQEIDMVLFINTSFAMPAKVIKSELSRIGLDNIKVGTVHTFQGAECDRVLFSSVYGANDSAGSKFYDRGNNMMNVAVSRAKNAFVVFGDRNVLGCGSDSSPSGLLRQYLSAIETNQAQQKTAELVYD